MAAHDRHYEVHALDERGKPVRFVTADPRVVAGAMMRSAARSNPLPCDCR